jgi:hypothetical protein
MNKAINKGLVIIAVVVSSMFLYGFTPVSPKAESGGTISGHVFDENMNVITDAEISVCAEGVDVSGGGYAAVSQTDGSYQMTALEPGVYRITANCDRAIAYETKFYNDEYRWGEADLITVESGQDTGNVDFALGPGGGISGHVYKADGVTPVKGICINASSTAPDWNQIAGWGSTDENGAFEFGGIPVGTAYIQVDVNCPGDNPSLINEWYATGGSTPDGSQASPVTITTGGTVSGIDFQLNEAGSISGTILKSDGTVIIDTVIRVHAEGMSEGTGGYGLDISQTDGTYTITGLTSGNYIVLANSQHANGYEARFYGNTYSRDDASLIAVTEGEEVSGIDIRIGPGGAISGHVYEADGVTPVAGACFNLSSTAPDWNQIASWGSTEIDGSFEFGGIPVGTAYIQVNPNCEGKNPNLIDEWYKTGGSTPDGSQASPVTITAGGTVSGIDFQLDAGGSISGRVLKSGGTVITDTEISVHAEGYSAGTSGRGTNISITDGTYTIAGLAPGTYKVMANNNRANGYETKYYNDEYQWDQADLVTVVAGADTGGVDFSLGDGGAISGHVYQADGVTPVSGACVNLTTSNEDWNQIAGWGSTDENGAFEFGGIPVGTAYVKVHANCNGSNPDLIDEWYKTGGSTPDGSQASPITITAGGTVSGIDFQLDEGGSISGHVLLSDGVTPIAGARVKALDDNFDWVGDASSDASGAYQITGLPTGAYYLFVEADGFGGVYYPNSYDNPGAEKVTVAAPDDTAGIDFAITYEATLSGHVYQSDGVTPIANARVQAWPANRGQIREATSGADGSFTVHGLSTGVYVASARADGYEDEFYQETIMWRLATPFQVTQPNDTANIDFTLSVPGAIPASERQALVDFYNATGGANWKTKTGWLGAGDPCAWYGVTCHDNHVAEIYLDNNNVTGELPAALQNLPLLQSLVLMNGKTSGAFPAWLGDFSNLRALVLNSNQISGVIPAEIGNLGKLKYFYAPNNQLSGNIPSQLGALPELLELVLSHNQLTGSLPSKKGMFPVIRILRLNSNRLSGDIPDELSSLTNLYDPGKVYDGGDGLDLGYNRLNVPDPYPSDPPTPLETYLQRKDPDWYTTQAKEVEAQPDTPVVLTSRDERTEIEIPAGAVEDATTFVQAPLAAPQQGTGNLAFANVGMVIEALDEEGEPLDSFVFNQPITITINYTDDDIAGLDEATLKIYYWDTAASAWVDAATTCTPVSEYNRQPDINRLSVQNCHLSEFAMLGVSTSQPAEVVADAYEVAQGKTLTVAAPGVLANDSDVLDRSLTASKASNPAHGALTFNANGSFTYTPDAAYSGTDTFTYKANNGATDSAPCTVTITVLASNWPTSLKPLDGTTLKAGITKLKMTWKIPTGKKTKDIKNYEVQLATDSAFTNIVASKTPKATNWTYSGLLPNTQYYWRVRAIFKTAPTTGSWSTVNQATGFTTLKTRPPALKAPGNNSKQVKPAVKLTWKRPTGCPKNTTYLLQYSTDPTFAAGVTEVSGLTSATYNLTTLPVSAAPGTTPYYWRVKAMDAGQTLDYSDWSAARSFKR